MKKTTQIIIAVLLAVVFAMFLGLGIECMLNLLSLSFSASPDANMAPSYPRFTLFCRVAGFASLVALVGIALWNVKLSDKLEYTDKIWQLQIALAIILSFPMIKVWEFLIIFLRKTF